VADSTPVVTSARAARERRFRLETGQSSRSQYFLIHPDGKGRRQISSFPDSRWLGESMSAPDGDSIAFAMGSTEETPPFTRCGSTGLMSSR